MRAFSRACYNPADFKRGNQKGKNNMELRPFTLKHSVFRGVCLVILLSFLGGCATGRDARDPFEPLNRGIYRFNEVVDDAVLKPVAQGYRFIVPTFVRSSVSNFFSNINDVIVALNNLLQGKFHHFVSDFGRIVINTTVGVGGLFDVASEAGVEKHDEDFGQTLGRYGVKDGPFLMIPVFGPSNARDAVGSVVDYYTNPLTYVRPNALRYGLWGTKLINRRAELLDAGTILEAAALDPYEFIRDAYLQRRRNLIYDGNPPPSSGDLDIEKLTQPVAPKEPIALREPARAAAAMVADTSAAEIDALLKSLPPVVASRRTARASFGSFETP